MTKRKATATAASNKKAKAPKKTKAQLERELEGDGEEEAAEAEEEEEYVEAEDAQEQSRSKKRNAKALSKLSQREKESKVAAAVRIILFKSARKKVVTSKDFYELMGDQHKGACNGILDLAAAKLMDVFGLMLTELPPAEKAGSQPQSLMNVIEEEERKTGQFILTSMFPEEQTAGVVTWGHEGVVTRLNLLVLTLIYAENMQVQSDKLWFALGELGIDRKKPHPYFGDVFTHIEKDMVAQKYLMKIRTGPQGSETELYRWGPRAKAEYTEEEILRFAAPIYGQEGNEWVEKMQATQHQMATNQADSDEEEE